MELYIDIIVEAAKDILHHLADLGEGKELQPIFQDELLVLEGKVSEHVCPGNGLPQQEERDLRQLPPSNQQAPGQVEVIVHAIVFIGPESDHWLCLSVTH